MSDKNVLRTYIIVFIITLVSILGFNIANLSDPWLNEHILYNVPFIENSAHVQLIFMIIALLVPYAAIFVGYFLASIFVRFYCRFTKFSKRIEFVGYARLERPKGYVRRRYLIQIIFGVFLSINIWIALVSSETIMSLLLSDTGKSTMFDEDSRMYHFPMALWYWLPAFIMALLFAMCAVIQDSGLVSMRKLSGQSEFVDTERVGDLLFGLVKGYAGFSVIINFYLLLATPLGLEASLTLYPFLAMMLTVHIIVAIDLFRNIGIKWIHKAVKKSYTPQLIDLNYSKTDIDPKELLIK